MNMNAEFSTTFIVTSCLGPGINKAINNNSECILIC